MILENVSTRHCLSAGRGVFLRRPLPMLLGWAAAGAITVLFVILFSSDLSTGLHVGVIVSALVLLKAQRIVLKSVDNDGSEEHPRSNAWRAWGRAFLAAAVVPTLFRVATWCIWFAVPLSGALMYAFFSYGIGDMFLCGRLDLLVGAVLFGSVGFAISSGLLFAPLCAVQDSRGALDALRRSWRMAGGHRMKILRIAVTCLWLPVSLALSAYFLSVLRTAEATFHGLPAVLWAVSLLLVVLFFGPWFSTALLMLYVPLKREEDGYIRRRVERKAAMNLPPSGNRGS